MFESTKAIARYGPAVGDNYHTMSSIASASSSSGYDEVSRDFQAVLLQLLRQQREDTCCELSLGQHSTERRGFYGSTFEVFSHFT
jgi:hypothetical protein